MRSLENSHCSCEMLYSEVINVVENANYVVGITFYSLLLFCLLFRTRQNLGAYRYLQIIMVTIDATYTTGQMIIKERMLTVNGLFAIIPTCQFEICRELLCLYFTIYNLTFVMIDYSFLYRMWAVKTPWRVQRFSQPWFIILLFSVALLESTLWFSTDYFLYLPTTSGSLRLRESTLLDFGVDTMNREMIMGDYFREDRSLNMTSVCANCVFGGVMSICFGFMIYAFYDIIHNLKVAKHISKTSVRLHRQLFITLCLQTIIPLICLYSPCGFMINLPLLLIDATWMARATPILISSFLPLDTLAVLVSMADYREEVARMLKCHRVPTPSTDTLYMTTRHSISTGSQVAPSQETKIGQRRAYSLK